MYDLENPDGVKQLVSKLHDIIKEHAIDARVDGNVGALDDLSHMTELSEMSSMPTFSETYEEGKWLERPPSYENVLASSNVSNIGSIHKESSTKLTDVFIPNGVPLDPPIVSGDLLDKIQMSSSAPNLHCNSKLQDEMSVSLSSSIKSKKSSKCDDPLAGSKVKHTKRSLSSINLRPRDGKAKAIIRLLAKTTNK